MISASDFRNGMTIEMDGGLDPALNGRIEALPHILSSTMLLAN